YRRCAGPARRAPRRRRRLRRHDRGVSRRARLPEGRPRPLPRARNHRFPAGRRSGRLAPRRTRAARDRKGGDRMNGHRLPRLGPVLALAALAATVAAYGANGDVVRRTAATATPATAAPGATGDQKWKKVVPGGECECADGSEFAFWERRADPT